jgi:hypothetical protein
LISTISDKGRSSVVAHFDLKKVFFLGLFGRWLLYIISLPGPFCFIV